MIIWKSISSIAMLIRRLVPYSETQCLKTDLKYYGRNLKLETGARSTHPEFVGVGVPAHIVERVDRCRG